MNERPKLIKRRSTHLNETPENNSRTNGAAHARLVTPQSYQIVHERHNTKLGLTCQDDNYRRDTVCA